MHAIVSYSYNRATGSALNKIQLVYTVLDRSRL
jgi:hypothetical protein